MKKIIIFISIALILVSAYFLFFKSKNNSSFQNQTTQTKVELSDVFNQIYQQLQSNSKISKIEKNSGSLWWISEDDQSILVPSQYSLTIDLPAKDFTPDKDAHHEISQTIQEILINNGFTLNSKNSSKNELDDQFYDYVQAFETENFKCVAASAINDGVSVDEEMNEYSYFEFSCVDNLEYQQAYDEQEPFILAYKKYQNLDSNDTSSVVSNIEINQDTARASIGQRRGGASAFFYQDNGQWTVVFAGQAVPECKELEDQEIPQTYWVSCLNQDGELQKGNPNFD